MRSFRFANRNPFHRSIGYGRLLDSRSKKRNLALFLGASAVAIPLSLHYFNPDAKYFFGSAAEPLSQQYFNKFVVTNNQEIERNIYLIELKPSQSTKSLPWSNQKIWSVQLKNPLIQIARHYTPLPVHLDPGALQKSNEVVLVPNSDKDARFCLLVKKYNDGDMTRYICSRNIGDTLELRGPSNDYIHDEAHISKFVMLTAGTGITVPLQLLLSEKEKSHIYTEVLQSSNIELPSVLRRLMNDLEKNGIAKFREFDDNSRKFVTANDIPLATSSSLAFVCGPNGYINYISGPPGRNGLAPVGGLLRDRNWGIKNTIRLID